ncbi:hypothetical protein PBI_OKIROE_42 [Mycobacterium phage OkiRoe]|uniref:transcriptional repressor n=1 Tax=Mycobacterium phage OkiRoe TaxID=1486473 RepID=UPI00045F72CB|nr:transcriptional repressor [Mycobacterium phage OkiRoe]AHZ95603.1 hypothetical protein PBI_OKIROE_42 [Mycobacterium phage OkiRoe]
MSAFPVIWCTVLFVTATTALKQPESGTQNGPNAIPTFQLEWNSDAVADLCYRNGIRSRGQLAQRINVGRSTIYETFGKQWEGTATAQVLAQMAGVFGVPLGVLVREPGRSRRGPATIRQNRHVTKRAG